MPRARPDGPTLILYRGIHYIAWWDGERRRRISTGTANPVIARQGLADFEAQLERRPAELTVSDALARYADTREGKIMAHDRLLQAAKVLREGMGSLRVDQVNQARWDRYAAARMTKPRPRQKAHKPVPVSRGTLRREYTVLRAAMRRAWKDGYLVRPPEIAPPADMQPRDRYLTKAEARALIDAASADQRAAHVRVFVALALGTGARRGSILSLTWDRVDMDRGIVDFQEAGRAITRKRRAIVPMTDILRPVLAEALLLRDADCPYVVAYQGRAIPFGMRWSFAKLCKAAGLTWTPTPHHMKHSVASWFAEAGVPMQQAADYLATDAKTLMRVYRKFDPAYLRTAAGALAF